MKSYSIRRRLISWISIPIIVVTVLAIVSSYFFSRHEIEEVYDAQLVHSAKVLLQLTQHEILEDGEFNLGIENLNLQHRYERNLGFRIWAGNKLVMQSSNTEDFEEFEADPGFSNHVINNHEWRFFVFLDPVNEIKIEVSERYDIRYELMAQLMISLIIPMLILLPIILTVIWIGVLRVLTPVVRISVDMDHRDSNDLSPIHNSAMPQEIAPLMQAINRLFKRLEGSFKREREFTDHAAHELRTPLAAMKTQTQVLLKKAHEFPEGIEGLENLQSSINRTTHLVEQLLSLARLQHEDLKKEKTDLSALIKQSILEIRPMAERKNILLSDSIFDGYSIQAHSGSISILLRNLMDNAVKYTPQNGAVTVLLTQEGELNITDNGPGLNDEDKKRVFERFVRMDKSGQTGSGLGLSIVQWIAECHNITIKLLDNYPTGLKAQIKWETVV